MMWAIWTLADGEFPYEHAIKHKNDDIFRLFISEEMRKLQRLTLDWTCVLHESFHVNQIWCIINEGWKFCCTLWWLPHPRRKLSFHSNSFFSHYACLKFMFRLPPSKAQLRVFQFESLSTCSCGLLTSLEVSKPQLCLNPIPRSPLHFISRSVAFQMH